MIIKAMISKAMIKFWYKFIFKFITGQLKKWPILNLWWKWSEILMNTTTFSNFTFLANILLFHD